MSVPVQHLRIGALIIGDEILSGKRQDRHFAHVVEVLARRGLKLAWARYEGDDRARLAAVLRETFAAGDLVFSCGGVGATPDDHTRQAAALALGVPLLRHPEAVAELEAQFGRDAYPNRIRMAEFPEGSAIIPNPVNRVASFSIRHHHFFPGFPQMAWPMLDWVLATHYPDLVATPDGERAIVVFGAGESQLLPLMEDNVRRFPQLRLFSLPSLAPNGERRIELGVKGDAVHVDVRRHRADFQPGLQRHLHQQHRRLAVAVAVRVLHLDPQCAFIALHREFLDPGAEAAGDPDLRPVPGAHFDAALEVVDLDPATRIQRPGLVDRGGGECRERCGSNDQDRGQGQDRGFQGQGHIGLLQA